MKKSFFLILVWQCMLALPVKAQNIPNGVTEPAAKTPAKPPKVLSASLFYKRTFTPKIPVSDPADVSMSSTIEEVGTTTAYFDGMGRPLQTVVKQASPLKRDVVVPVAYDTWGNVYYNYLPYTAQTGNTNDGKIKTSPFTADSAFYKTLFPEEDIYYGRTIYDGSPLNKITKQMAPGNSWAGNTKGISYTENANALTDSVRIWSININGAGDIPTTTAVYPAGSLLVQTVTDERGKKTVSYINERGETVLTKTQLSNTIYTGHTGWLCTYYIYDEMGHLRMVIPPKATSFLLLNSWNLAGNTDVVDNLCYSYWYDNRGRITQKHIPGKGDIYIAYDLFDRIVMTQDEKLRTTSEWAFVKYDEQSRPAQTGVITKSGVNKDTITNQAARSSNYPALSGTYTVMTQTYYDDYAWISEAPFNESLYTTPINSSNFITTYNTAPYYAQQITKSVRIRGKVTGSKKLILGTSTYLYATQLYDENGRAIQTKQTNLSGGVDISTVQYSYAGLVLRQQLHHAKSSPGTQTHELLTKYSYDHESRLKTITKKIDATAEQLTYSADYDEAGRTKTKTLGDALASQAYTYNIRGWLTGINKTYAEQSSNTAGKYFGESLFYDYGFTTTQVNGNIAGIQWKSTGDNVQRAYGFTYDNMNRLTKADFTQKNSSSADWTKDKMDFSVSGLSYDQNGNITKMTQRGTAITGPVTIDSLTYTYFTNSNQLQKVKDLITTAPAMGDFQDTSYTGNDYDYDENGNLVKDNNKHIHTSGGGNGITPNILDKPDSIVVDGKGSIRYTYDAGGSLLQKTITDKKLNVKTVITYAAGFVYQKVLPAAGNPASVPDTLQYVLHEEGRIRWSYTQSHSSGYFVYDYFLKDHLANIRSVITDEQDTSVYPIASLETANINTEKLYYSGLDSGVVTKGSITGYPTNDTYTSPNNYIQRLRGDGIKTGAGILLKVMAGDTINVHAASWWKSDGTTPGSPASPLTDIVNSILSSLPVTSGGKFTAGSVSNTNINPSINGFLSQRNATENTGRPRSWLNIIVLDEQLKQVVTNDGRNSYFEQVGAGSTTSVQQYNTSRPITKNGYVYIFVSNETQNIYTYWDDLQVSHVKGHLLQEEGYYPFGLEMKAITSAAAIKQQARYKFNAGTELEDNFDVNYYETYFRQYDAQIGRFTGVDALAEKTIGISTYQFGNNNPVLFNDPTGAMADAKPKGPPTIYNDIDKFVKSSMYHNHWWDEMGFFDMERNGGGWGSGGGFWSSAANFLQLAKYIANNGLGIDGIFDESGNAADALRWTFDNNGNTTSLSELSSTSMMLYTAEGQWNISLDGSNTNFASNVSYNTNERDRFKQFIAIVAGESSNNLGEAAGIGSVIFNRMKFVNTNFAEDFVSDIGGKGQFDAIGGTIYNQIMNMTWSEIASETNTYATRISGAFWSLFGGIDFSNGAYFWNATWQKNSNVNIGSNWRAYNAGTFVITTQIGGTTFFKYTDSNKHWP